MAARKKPQRRGFNFSSGYGGGFIWPVFALTIDTSQLTIYSDQATLVGTFAPTPADGVVNVIDNDGNKFQLANDGLSLQAGSVATGTADQPTQPINVTVTWGGKSVAFPFTITLRDPSTLLSGGHTFAHGAVQGTAIGDLSSDPSSGITYSIVTQDIVNGVQIGAPNHLQKGSGVVSAGAYSVTVRATKGSNHWDTVFALTAT